MALASAFKNQYSHRTRGRDARRHADTSLGSIIHAAPVRYTENPRGAHAFRARTRAVKICTITRRTEHTTPHRSIHNITYTKKRVWPHAPHGPKPQKHLFWYVHLGITIGKPVLGERAPQTGVCVSVHSNGASTSPSSSMPVNRPGVCARACLPCIVMRTLFLLLAA